MAKRRKKEGKRALLTALFLGRFQPLHNGHLHIIKGLARKGYMLKIVVGSSQEQGTELNPFSFARRKRLIVNALNLTNIREYRVYAVPDIKNDEHYVAHVKMIVGRFDVVHAAENLMTYRLFYDAGYRTYRCKRWHNISSTSIRNSFLRGTKLWKRLVPKENISLIEGWNGTMPERQAREVESVRRHPRTHP